ncbi:MAG: S9 family peptidase [Bacteroidales bacterium]|jgi:dipeptidyl aminopeptidase/acylaminoacyl peptidase|nr:S9 family peptidase [Bacteroidales bacterium]
MKKILSTLFLILIVMSSCQEKKVTVKDENLITKENREVPDFSKGVLTEEILWYLGRVADPQLSPDGKMLLYTVKYFDYKKNKGNQEVFTIPVAGGEPTQLTTTPQNEFGAIWRPDGKKVIFLRDVDDETVQAFECNLDGSDVQQITNIEGGINSLSFAPDMKHVAYFKTVQVDPTIVDRYPDLPLATGMIYDDLMYRHWDHWNDGSYEHLFVADYPSFENSVDLLNTEKFDATDLVWSSDNKSLAYTCKRLSGKAFAESTNTDVFIYNIKNKQTKNITADNLGYDLAPVFSPDGSKIAWSSMKTDGFESDKQRLFIHDFNTGISEDYSKDFDQSCTDFVWSKDGKKMWFLSCISGTYQVYELSIADHQIKKLTKGEQDYHSLALAAEDQLVTSKTKHSLPAELFAINCNDGAERQITHTNDEVLAKITMGETVAKWITTTDGKPMLTWVILPPNFDSTKTYPTLLYCEGGPQSPVSQFFSYRWNFQIMAAHGYIIVAPNRRGLPGFGQEWNDQISLDYGGQNMKDYLSAIDFMAKEPYVDANRLGAVGASYGGFSVYWLAGHHQKRFKCFIAHCGMFNFESWYGTTEELFFANHDIGGAFWENPTPKSYEFSPHKFIGNWDTPLLVIHGGNDFRIPYTEGMQAFDAAQMKGIPSRFLFFSDESHFVLKPQNSILWQREFFRWLDGYLK